MGNYAHDPFVPVSALFYDTHIILAFSRGISSNLPIRVRSCFYHLASLPVFQRSRSLSLL